MRGRTALISAAIAVAIPLVSRAQVVTDTSPYVDNFNTDTSANYNKFITAGATGPSSDATFAYNYGAAPASGGLSIPAAPNTTDGSTIGLRLRVDNLQSSTGTVVGAIEVATKNLTLPSQYLMRVDVWSNYIGGNTTGTGLTSSGSNGSTGVTVGVGTSGNSLQYIVSNDGMLTEAFGDNGGGANGAYRVYVDNTSPRPQPTNSSYYVAGTGAASASNTDPYYTAKFPSVSAPSGQSTFSATQQGQTPAGTQGFAWHTWVIANDGTNVTWSIDGLPITIVPVSALTFGGSQVSLGNDDTGLTGSSAANNQLFNAEIFDNLYVVPEPASLGFFAMGGIALLRRRSKR